MAQGPRHMVSGKEVEVKQATPRGAVQQPPAVPAGPGPGPSGGGMLYPPRPGFAGAFGGPAGHPGAYGAVGPYAPHMQYQAGPGYGMPGYGQVPPRLARARPPAHAPGARTRAPRCGHAHAPAPTHGRAPQAAFPAYSGLMLPHPGAYGYQHGYPYGHGYGAPQHLGGAGGYEQQAAQAAAQLPLQAMQAQGPPQYGLPGSSRQLAHPRSRPRRRAPLRAAAADAAPRPPAAAPPVLTLRLLRAQAAGGGLAGVANVGLGEQRAVAPGPARRRGAGTPPRRPTWSSRARGTRGLGALIVAPWGDRGGCLVVFSRVGCRARALVHRAAQF